MTHKDPQLQYLQPRCPFPCRDPFESEQGGLAADAACRGIRKDNQFLWICHDEQCGRIRIGMPLVYGLSTSCEISRIRSSCRSVDRGLFDGHDRRRLLCHHPSPLESCPNHRSPCGDSCVALSLTRLFRLYRPWLSFALMSFLSTFFADRLSHAAPLGPPWSEALTTACGAAVVSALISLAPFAAAVERLENPDFHP